MARAALGDEVVDHYLNYARTEQELFDSVVTCYERERMFERASPGVRHRDMSGGERCAYSRGTGLFDPRRTSLFAPCPGVRPPDLSR